MTSFRYFRPRRQRPRYRGTRAEDTNHASFLQKNLPNQFLRCRPSDGCHRFVRKKSQRSISKRLIKAFRSMEFRGEQSHFFLNARCNPRVCESVCVRLWVYVSLNLSDDGFRQHQTFICLSVFPEFGREDTGREKSVGLSLRHVPPSPDATLPLKGQSMC